MKAALGASRRSALGALGARRGIGIGGAHRAAAASASRLIAQKWLAKCGTRRSSIMRRRRVASA